MSNEIVKRSTLDIVISGDSYKSMLTFASELLKTGFLPEAIKTPAQVVSIILTGQELGITPMHALRTINVIKGKPTLSSEVQLAIFRRNGGQVQWVESTNEKAVLKLKHPNDDNWHTETYTIADATKAGLTMKENYKKIPKPMLKARCATAGLRACAPDIQMGVYDPEELGILQETGENIPEIEKAEVVEDTASVESPPSEPEPADDDRPISPENDTSSKFYALNRFKAAKAKVGEEAYYKCLLDMSRVLDSKDWAHANIIPVESRDKVIERLIEIYHEKKAEKQEEPGGEIREIDIERLSEARSLRNDI